MTVSALDHLPLRRHVATAGRGWWQADLVAGLVLVGLLAPAGMAYAVASGLPPEVGIYSSIVPLLAYALVGPSRIMVLGPDSSLTPLVLAATLPFVTTDPAHAVAVAGMLAILTGVICLAAAVARLGFLAELLSSPVRLGYLHGIALTIGLGQTATILGTSAPGESLGAQIRAFVDGLADSGVDSTTLVLGTGGLAMILVLRSVLPRVPAALVAVVTGIVATAVFDLGTGPDAIALVGDLPRGLPLPTWPALDVAELRSLVGAAVGVAFVAFADTSVLSRTLAVRRHESVGENHELFALGAGKVAAGLFGGMPVSSSASRTPVAESAGARTPVTGIVAAAVLGALTVVAPHAFRLLPKATLAAVVLGAVISLVDLPALVRLLRFRRSEFALAMAATVLVAVLGPVSGAIAAVALSVIDFLRRVWRPHTAELVRVDGLKGYHDRARHPEGRVVPGLLLYRFDAPLMFANARVFADDLNRHLAGRSHDGDPAQTVIVTAEPITDVDSTAAEMLEQLVADLDERGIDLRFAELKGSVHEQVDRYSATHGTMPDHTARTTGEAVRAYLHESGVEWTDWEDRIGDASGDDTSGEAGGETPPGGATG